MKLEDTKLRETYYHSRRKSIVRLITCDPIDGASLLVEPVDEHGDVIGDLFRCEACDLTPFTPEMVQTVTIPC